MCLQLICGFYFYDFNYLNLFPLFHEMFPNGGKIVNCSATVIICYVQSGESVNNVGILCADYRLQTMPVTNVKIGAHLDVFN